MENYAVIRNYRVKTLDIVEKMFAKWLIGSHDPLLSKISCSQAVHTVDIKKIK